MPWLAFGDFHRIMQSTNALCQQQIVLTIACQQWLEGQEECADDVLCNVKKGLKYCTCVYCVLYYVHANSLIYSGKKCRKKGADPQWVEGKRKCADLQWLLEKEKCADPQWLEG
jgi:hypothetical protein